MRNISPHPPAARRVRSTAGLLWIGVALIGGVFVLVRLADLLLLIFASVLMAMLLLAIAAPLQTRLRMPRSIAVATVLVALTATVGLVSWGLGAQIAQQLSSLTVLLPKSWRAF